MAETGKEMSGSVRRSLLGIGVSKWGKTNLGTIDVLCSLFKIDDSWQLLRRSKQLLAMRSVTPALVAHLDYRQAWNQWRVVDTVLDLFPALKYSYSSLRGKPMVGVVNILSNGSKARIGDIARSHSIRLDPVEAPKELFKYRQRIQKIIDWAYKTNLVPVMMTLTLYHRWQPLAPLCRVLRAAWSDLFARSKAGLQRKQLLGLRGYVRRMEETFNDGDGESATNAGWHPHYHVILLVPRENLTRISEYEETLKAVWLELVRKHFVAEFGEDIPAAYYDSFREHGLVFSRYKSEEHAARCGNVDGKTGELLEVHDGKYLAKIMGTDDPLYGGDNELTVSMQKNSKSPFDMLRGKVTANLADLWCEYALATKKIPSFTFSQGLQKEVDEYFAMKPSAVAVEELPEEKIVGGIAAKDYQKLYRLSQAGNLLTKATEGTEALKVWLKQEFDMDLVNASADEVLECLPLSDYESESVPTEIETNGSNVSACSEVVSCSNVGACGSPFIKRAPKPSIFVAGVRFVADVRFICGVNREINNQNKSPPCVVGRNKAPPKLNESRVRNGRQRFDSS